MLLFIHVRMSSCVRLRNFNTSHVTVYPELFSDHIRHHQYFNTSHVTVYQFFGMDIAKPGIFQYISCYCLSFCAGVGRCKRL